MDCEEVIVSQSYAYEEIPKLYGLMDNSAIESTGALRLQNIPGLELKGNGIIIGIIDNRIDAYHEAFRYSNGNTRILNVWNQQDSSLEPPEKFRYGSRINQETINEELQKENSEILINLSRGSNHGTFLAGIAAGNLNVEKGLASPAPMAGIVVVKLKEAKDYLKSYYFLRLGAEAYQENDIINGIVYINQIADEMKMPVIICIPLGTNQGSHGGLSVIGDFINSYGSRTGIGIVCAMGNEGNSRNHYSGLITKADDYDDVQLRVGANVEGISLEIWGQSPDIFEVEIISPTGKRVKRVQSSSGQEEVYRLLFERTTIYVKYEFIGEETYFLKPDPFNTLTKPADSYIPISVGAYNNADGSLYINTSRGYPTDMDVKPTFVAPGVNVLGPGPNNSYIRLSGTSISAAITAGVMAQFMEWGIVKGNKINLNTTEIKNYRIRGSERKAGITFPNREWGFGTLDAYNSIDVLRG